MERMNISRLNDFLQYPSVIFEGLHPSAKSFTLTGMVHARGDEGELLASEPVAVNFRELEGLEMEGAVRLCRGRINEAKSRLAEKLKDVAESNVGLTVKPITNRSEVPHSDL